MRVSFIHAGDPTWASYRYRALAPARWLGASMNDWSADVVVLAKPLPHEVVCATHFQRNGGRVIVDICDDHFDRLEYQKAAAIAELVTCPTAAMAQIIWHRTGQVAMVIPEAYEFEHSAPHCTGTRLLWFGHGSNYESLARVLPWLQGYPLEIVSNHPQATTPWSVNAVRQALTRADIVLLPATAPGKSPNRAVEAIRSGCLVIAEPHRSLIDIPGVWIGPRLEQGIEWAQRCPGRAIDLIADGQAYVAKYFAPACVAQSWREAIALVATQAVAS